MRRYGRFVDGRTIHARMAGKDARMNDRRVGIRARPVGMNHGFVGRVVTVSGRCVHETFDIYPTADQARLNAASWAQARNMDVTLVLEEADDVIR